MEACGCRDGSLRCWRWNKRCVPAGIETAGVRYPNEVMYWAGYIYRYWHYYTGESSKAIVQTADAETMESCWLGFHTLDVEMAIDDLKELHRQRTSCAEGE